MSFTTSLSGNGYDQPDTIHMTPGSVARSWILSPADVADLWDEPTVVRMLLAPAIFQAGTNAIVVGDYNTTVRGGVIAWKHTIDAAPVSTSMDGLDPSDGGLDWLWWGEAHLNHTNLQFLGTQFADYTGGSGVVDVRTKRKLELGYGLVGAFHCLPWSFPAGGGAWFHLNGRILLLNH